MLHIDTMLHLRDQLLTEERIQEQIDVVRAAHPHNQLLQLRMDRNQETVNRRRACIAEMMHDIAASN